MGPWDTDRERQQEIAALATRELLRIARDNPDLPKERFAEVYQALVDKYGQLSADSAMRALEKFREAAGQLDVLPAVRVAKSIPIEQVRGSFVWAFRETSEDDLMALARLLAGPLGRLVRQRGRETVWDNTVAAGTRYARLPGGAGMRLLPDACLPGRGLHPEDRGEGGPGCRGTAPVQASGGDALPRQLRLHRHRGVLRPRPPAGPPGSPGGLGDRHPG
ncbi:hypothetical protein CSPHI_08450 [Corynebacterium sphenisci DSM 44792]|uniref:Uncharacterized protein n=1 Tax=Corynebacterium sphenisci DSM 44792 TaxID=1437874 RepID=A0A1L7CZ39_9CORY|nr:hypothetical protein [Corynebacterium sphenisci]APT91053.1 hypothetical protein CSPHI_08450 [Corynebacterium sphenisci DSM 44792]